MHRYPVVLSDGAVEETANKFAFGALILGASLGIAALLSSKHQKAMMGAALSLIGLAAAFRRV